MPQRPEISSLLEAEKVASVKIDEARKRKIKRLKEAQQEAKAEIEQLKNTRDADYKLRENEQLGNRKEMEENSKKLTESSIENLKSQFEENKDEILQKLIDLVSDIVPEAHINARH